ncbi:MAG TPA: acyltransferase family protein [Cellvibrio sp.]|nr:acyltransferase family protein [Cellvibrio sp.]
MTAPEKLARPQMAVDLSNQRLIELDWLRVLVFGLLIFYHTGMLYAEGWDWHYKSTYSSKLLTDIMLWSNQWRMSLLFLISGAAVSFLLARQPWGQFICKRVPLLLLPLLFGMLVIVVPQVYVEAHSKGLINCPNYWQFWYAYLDQTSAEFAQHKTLGRIHLTWNHLWFLPYILAYTLILWTVYPLVNAPQCRPLWQWLKQNTHLNSVIFVPILLFYGIGWWLYEKHPVTHNFVQDWFNHARSFLCFVLGFALVRMPQLWSSLVTLRWQLLPAALLTYAYALFSFNGGSLGDGALAKQISGLIWSANGWLWILTIIAWAQRGLKFSNPLLTYLNSGVYCFYILHQTLIIALAYALAPRQLGAFTEPLLIISGVSLSCIGLFEVIKRLPLLPVLLGIQRR